MSYDIYDGLGHSDLWWPHLHKDLESHVCTSVLGQVVRDKPTLVPLQPCVWFVRPWLKVHLIFASHFEKKILLIRFYAHSKWPDIVRIAQTTGGSAIMELKWRLANYKWHTSAVFHE